jgi:hypothetical protein
MGSSYMVSIVHPATLKDVILKKECNQKVGASASLPWSIFVISGRMVSSACRMAAAA